MTLVDFHHVELPPPLNQHVHIQTYTDGDYSERVVTPLGTTHLKIQGCTHSCWENLSKTAQK